jgi:hypothetical protein
VPGCIHNAAVARRPIIAATGESSGIPELIDDELCAVAVLLDLVQPAVAGGRLLDEDLGSAVARSRGGDMAQ